MSERTQVIVGNWKMYKTIEQAREFVQTIIPMVKNASRLVYLAVPFTAIKPVSDQAKDSNIVIGAQNMNDASEGAFTGEIAAKMLVEAGAKFVILGHSERRKLFGETSEFINKKVKRALIEGIQPIVCIGETLSERESGAAERIIEEQLTQTLADVDQQQLDRIFLAYEPVWAIGTGRTASLEQAHEMHKFCRGVIGRMWSDEAAEKITILYGGSVRPENASHLLEQPDIDGLLVGGASLSTESFSEIINYQTNKAQQEVT